MRPADYEQALQAARSWIAEHGRYPQQQEWEYQALARPTTRTIKRRHLDLLQQECPAWTLLPGFHEEPPTAHS